MLARNLRVSVGDELTMLGSGRDGSFAAAVLTLRNPTLPARILTSLTQASLPWQYAAAFVMLVPSLIVIFIIRRYLLGLWGRVVK